MDPSDTVSAPAMTNRAHMQSQTVYPTPSTEGAAAKRILIGTKFTICSDLDFLKCFAKSSDGTGMLLNLQLYLTEINFEVVPRYGTAKQADKAEQRIKIRDEDITEINGDLLVAIIDLREDVRKAIAAIP